MYIPATRNRRHLAKHACLVAVMGSVEMAPRSRFGELSAYSSRRRSGNGGNARRRSARSMAAKASAATGRLK